MVSSGRHTMVITKVVNTFIIKVQTCGGYEETHIIECIKCICFTLPLNKNKKGNTQNDHEYAETLQETFGTKNQIL